jgi:plastocyanin
VQRGRDKRSRHAGLLAAAATLAVSGVVAGVGVAGAAPSASDAPAANADVYARDNSPGAPCFSTVATGDTCTAGEKADVTIATGETVTWHFNGGAGGAAGLPHNAVDADNPGTPAWREPPSGLVTSGSYPHTFTQPGVYPFVCQAHPSMTGTVTVEGDPMPTPTATQPTPTATPTVTATATATPAPTASATPPPNTGITPRPGGAADTVDPAVRRVRLTALRRAIRVRFTLSEPATVTVAVKRRGARKVLKSARLQARAGARTVTLRSRKLRKGRYTVEIAARDAFGNRSRVTRKQLSVPR